MLKNFNLQIPKDPAGIAKAALVALLLCNLVAGYFVLFPPGGSPKELDEQVTNLRAQVLQRTVQLKLMRAHAEKIQRGRGEGDQFLNTYFLTARTSSSSIVDELSRSAKEAKITPKEHSIQSEDIEGSDTLKMLTINGNYEGTYADLIEFINRIDRSSRLLIIESMNASPQQGKGRLNINVKMNTFVRTDGGAI